MIDTDNQTPSCHQLIGSNCTNYFGTGRRHRLTFPLTDNDDINTVDKRGSHWDLTAQINICGVGLEPNGFLLTSFEL